jgi:hypothetical protein
MSGKTEKISEFTNLITVKISAIMLRDGGALILHIQRQNQNKVKIGIYDITLLDNNKFREFNLSYMKFAAANIPEDTIPCAIKIKKTPKNAILEFTKEAAIAILI